MDLDPQNASPTLQTGIAQISALVVSYSFSAVGAIVLLIVGYMVAGLAERSLFAGLGQIHGFDATLAQLLLEDRALRRSSCWSTVMVLGQFGVQTASIIAAHRRDRPGDRPGAAGDAAEHRRRHHAAGAPAVPHRRICRGRRDRRHGRGDRPVRYAPARRRRHLHPRARTRTLWNQPVRNFTRNGIRRNDITVGIGYDDDIDLAQKTLIDLATGRRAASKATRRRPLS